MYLAIRQRVIKFRLVYIQALINICIDWMWRVTVSCVQSFSSDDTVNTGPPATHTDICRQQLLAAELPTMTSPRVFLDTHRDVIANDVITAESRDDDNVAMVTQRTITDASDNDDDIADTVARQPAAGDDVTIDDVMQPMNGNHNDVILIPEAMIDGIWRRLLCL